jgi:inhibitor of KinA sporulation pathway (predicted exonuclease)
MSPSGRARKVIAMATLPRLLNVIDVEATCWETAPPPGEIPEIIEIGVTVVDTAARRRIRRCGVLVRPEHSSVSAFCTGLTGLSAGQVARGLTFAAACRWLEQELDSTTRPWASWGEYDRRQFTAQCAVSELAYPFAAAHRNLRAEFAAAFGLSFRPSVPQALDIARLPLEGNLHRGEDDAWNIAALALVIDEKERDGRGP